MHPSDTEDYEPKESYKSLDAEAILKVATRVNDIRTFLKLTYARRDDEELALINKKGNGLVVSALMKETIRLALIQEVRKLEVELKQLTC